MVRRALEELSKLGFEIPRLTLTWIKAHVGHEGNDTNRAKRILQLPRLKMKRFVEITTVHNNLSYFQFKIDPDVNPMCRFCEEENETFHHFITNCPRPRQVRLDNIRYFTPYDWKVNELLQFSFTPEINDYLERKDY